MDSQNEALAADLPRALCLLQDLKSNCVRVNETVDKLIQQVNDGTLDTSKGITFLEVKYHLLLSYLINLTFTMLIKVNGKKLEGDEAIDRIVEIRTVLEKIRPIEQKLRYQIDKLVKTATTGVVNERDALTFAANPEHMIENESDDDENVDRQNVKANKLYVPPKLAAMHYDGDEHEERQKLLENTRKRALSNSVIQDLRQQYSEGPQEIFEQRDFNRVKASQEAKERTRYEEERMVRLTVSKKEKNKVKGFANLNDLTHFGDFNPMGEEMEISKKKKRSYPTGKRKTRKSPKKRRH